MPLAFADHECTTQQDRRSETLKEKQNEEKEKEEEKKREEEQIKEVKDVGEGDDGEEE